MTLLALHQYLGLGVELLTPASRSLTNQQIMKRQTSQQHQDLERLLKKQLSNPEAEIQQNIPPDESTMSLLFSNVILQSKGEIEAMNYEQMRRLSYEAFQEVLNLSDEQLNDFPYSMKDFININEPDEGNDSQFSKQPIKSKFFFFLKEIRW